MNEAAPDILLSSEKPEFKPLCLVSTDELADDTPLTPEKFEPNAKLKSMCPVSVDEVTDDTPVAPERIEPNAEFKPLCLVSEDEVAEATPITPERIEPKGVPMRHKSNGNIHTSSPLMEVRARYLDTSSSSCHDFCKYGRKNLMESSRTFIAKQKKKLVTNSKTSSERNVETTNQPQLPAKKIDRPAKSMIKRASSLSTPGAKSDKKFSDVILRKGVDVIQVSPTGGLLSKGKKKELVSPNALLSAKPSVKRETSGKSQNVKKAKEVSHLRRHSTVGKGETKQTLNEDMSEEKKSGSEGKDMKSVGQTPIFENKKGKQKSPGAVTSQSSLISHKKISGLKGDQNAKSQVMKKLDRIPIFERGSTKTQNQIAEKKVELVSWPKRVVHKKVGLEEKTDSAHKLAFKRGKVVEVKPKYMAPRRLKFKPRKVVVEDLNGKAEDVAGSKTEPLEQMTNYKVGINGRLKRVGKIGFEGKNENLFRKLDFERGKSIDIQPKNTAAPRRLKSRKVVVQNVNGDNTRRNFKKVFRVDEVKGSNTEHLRVVLKHQDVEEKKDVQSSLNNVIEETATRLVRLRKSKVKALVGAFESLMSLPDAKSSTTSAS